MTKQEVIREGIKKRFVMAGLSYEMAEISARSVMKDLDSQGVKIKVSDIEPINSYEDLTRSISEGGKYDIAVVEPLIKEEY